MRIVEQLAAFVTRSSYDDLSVAARQALKVHILDTLAVRSPRSMGRRCGRYAHKSRNSTGPGPCSLIGGGPKAPDRAAFYNATLVRYLDFNDSYLAQGETSHPSDNLGAVLATAEYAGASGRDLPRCTRARLPGAVPAERRGPVRAKGFDHVTQGAYAVAAGSRGRSASMPPEPPTRSRSRAPPSTRCASPAPDELSNWKGLAYPNIASGAS